MKSPDYIGVNKWGGTFDRSIDMTFCRQVQDRIRLKAMQKIEESIAGAKI
jgi:hypothetical protein